MTLFWSNVGVDVQSAVSAAQNISGITKANPGVVQYVGADPANGDYVMLSVTGMVQINERIFRVANVNAVANTFELEGEDTTTYDTFASGTIEIITFGSSFRSVQGINVSGGDYEFADTTTIHDLVRKRAPTIASPMSLSMDNLYDLADPGFVECNNAFKAKAQRAVRLRFGTGARMLLVGYCGAAGVPTGQAQGVVQTKVTIESQNIPTVYAT